MSVTYQNILKKNSLSPNKDWFSIKTIDMHTGGEPLRVIIDGFPELLGNSVLDYRRHCKTHFDNLRKALIFEPRGHADMYACILVPPNDDEGDFGILFLHNEGYSTMCGHAIIAISTLAVELKWISVKEGDNELKIDAPCGRITAFTKVNNGKVTGVRFHCVPSFVIGLDKLIEVPDLGLVNYDLAYGGAFYAYVDLAKNDLNLDLNPSSYTQLIAHGMAIKNAITANNTPIEHPFEKDLSFLYGTIFIDNEPQASGADSRNVCVFAEGEVDRCPTGSGVAGRMAIHYVRNEITTGKSMTIESICDSTFKGSIVKEVTFGKYQAVIPQVEGTAYITGKHTFLIDPDDPMKEGFMLR